jgi:hypothetical protein
VVNVPAGNIPAHTQCFFFQPAAENKGTDLFVWVFARKRPHVYKSSRGFSVWGYYNLNIMEHTDLEVSKQPLWRNPSKVQRVIC